MDRTNFLNKYSRFDTPDIAERIAEEINKYIEYDGIEYLHSREIHGRHTGYLDISSGGFRNVYDFICPILNLCQVDRKGIVSADIKKIEKHLAIWRTTIKNISDKDLELINDLDFTEDDSLYVFRNAAYNAELDGFMKLDSPSTDEIVVHEEALEEIWNLSSTDNIGCPEEEIEIYDKVVEDMDKQQDSFLNKCREIFYTEGKEALREYIDRVEKYSSKKDGEGRFDDQNSVSDFEIRQIRVRFDVWEVEKERLKMEEMWEKMQKDVDDYWNDPDREQRGDWVSPTLVQDLKGYFEECHNQPSFAEFVSLIRRGEFGILPKDYDGLASPGDPGYYGE